MSVLRRAVERIVAWLKREPGYRIAPDLDDAQLAIVLWHRGGQLARGLTLRRRVRGVVLRGRGVRIAHARQLSAGTCLILEDGVSIDALSRDGIALGRNVTIARGAVLVATGVLAELGVGIRVGDRSAVGAGAFLGGQGGITIGDDVIMGPHVRIFSENHAFGDVRQSIRTQGTRREAVTIANDCWIGAGATILAGVTIGAGCVIAAGAVVTRDVAPRSVMAGVPARVMGARVREAVAGRATDMEDIGGMARVADTGAR